MSRCHEYETTCGIVFDGTLYEQIVFLLSSKSGTEPVEENVDIYEDPQNGRGRYRSLTRYSKRLAHDDVRIDYRRFDHKITSNVLETQIPHISNGRVIFITCTYKESTERVLTEDEWKKTVVEDHVAGRYMRTYNKKRWCFFDGAFAAHGGGVRNARVTVGEQSSCGGTLEARTTCNSIYYLEIELETDVKLNELEATENMHRLCGMLFELLSYDVVKLAMLASNTISVQRERLDSLFDTFKRRFLDYNRCRNELHKHAGKSLDFFVMPKWDGIRATGIYFCEGFLMVKDACGRMTTFRTKLPFDNDMIFQLEVVENVSATGTDSAGRYYVITELMAVLIKSHNTIFAVYGRNNTIHNTGRNIGNAASDIAIKTQFAKSDHVCNLYRTLPARVSLQVLSEITKLEICRRTTNTTAASHHRYNPVITITSVVNLTDGPLKPEEVLNLLSTAFTGDGVVLPDRETKSSVIVEFTQWLPEHLRNDNRFKNDCEGLIVAFARRVESPFAVAEHGYFKLKHTDTVDLELDLDTGKVTSADLTEYKVEGLPTLETVQSWAERPSPIRNRRIIVECYYDNGKLRFMKERCDKNRPDSDDKIRATDRNIYDNCRIEHVTK